MRSRNDSQGMKNEPVAVPDKQKALAIPRRLLKYLATKMTPVIEGKC